MNNGTLLRTTTANIEVVPVEGIEPPLLAEHDFEFVRVYQFRHTGMRRHLYPKAGAPGKRKSPARSRYLAPARRPRKWACFRLKDRPIAAGREGRPRGCDDPRLSTLRMTWLDRLRAEPAATAALAIFVGSSATIVGAWFFEFVLKLPPCPLCLEERLPYHIVIALSLLMAIAALARAPRTLLAVGFTAIIVAMLCGAVLGAYHAGVEWHWWAGPTDCSGPITDLSAKGSILGQLTFDPRGALRRSGVALARHFARRLQRADLAGAGRGRRLRPARLPPRRLIGRHPRQSAVSAR